MAYTIGDELQLDSIADFDMVFDREDTGMNAGAWVEQNGGRTQSGSTGPGNNTVGAYVYTESSNSSGETDLEENSVATVLAAVMSAWTGTGRIMSLRAAIMGNTAISEAGGIVIEGRVAAGDTWTLIELLEGWPWDDGYTAGETVTDHAGATHTIVENGGWIDFDVTIPDAHTEVRIRLDANDASLFRNDAALRSVQLQAGAGADTMPTVMITSTVMSPAAGGAEQTVSGVYDDGGDGQSITIAASATLGSAGAVTVDMALMTWSFRYTAPAATNVRQSATITVAATDPTPNTARDSVTVVVLATAGPATVPAAPRQGRRWWIDVELPDGSVLGPIVTADAWSSNEKMDQVGDFSFSLPATDPLSDALVFRSIVRCYGVVAGAVTEIGSGMVYERKRDGAAPGAIVRAVSGPGLGIQLSDVSVRNLQLGSEDAPITHVEAVETLDALAPAGWQLHPDVNPPFDTMHASYAGESLLEACIDVAEQGRTHFRFNERELVFRSDFEALDLIATEDGAGGLRISAIDETIDGSEVATVVIPFGGEIAGSALTLADSSDEPAAGQSLDRADNRLQSDAGVFRIGEIEKVRVWEEVVAQADTAAAREAAANLLLQVASTWLARREQELFHYKVIVEDPPQLIRPLQKLRVRYRGRGMDVDRDLFVVGVSHRLGDESWASELALSSVDLRQATGLDVLIESIRLVRRLTRRS